MTFEWMIEHDRLIIARVFFRFWNTVGTIRYYITSRGICWLFGCNEKRGRGWNMPEDCIEWWCPRCGANGINHQVWTRELLEGTIPKLRQWFRHLPGRIHKRICKHKEIHWHTYRVLGRARTSGFCKKCHKHFYGIIDKKGVKERPPIDTLRTKGE